MRGEQMATQAQIRIIHTLKGKLGWDNDKYHDALQERCQVSTSKNLTKRQGRLFIEWLMSLVSQDVDWEPRNKATDPDYATPAQRTALEHMWAQVSWANNFEAQQKGFRAFMMRIVKYDEPRWLTRKDAQKLHNALLKMIENKNKKQNKEAV